MTVDVEFRLSDEQVAAVEEILRSNQVDGPEAGRVLRALTAAILRLGVDPVRDRGAVHDVLEGIFRVRGSLPRPEISAREDPPGSGDPADAPGLGDVLEEFRERLGHLLELKQRESASVGELMEDIRRQPQPRRRWLLRNSRRFHSHGLAEHLLHAARDLWHEDPGEAERLVGVALEVCERLDEEVYCSWMVHDLRARAFAHLANSRRVLGLVRSVGEIFDAADYHFRRGSGDPGQWALYFILLSQLRLDQRRFEETLELVELARVIYEAVGDLQDKARTLLHQALVNETSAAATNAPFTEGFEVLEQVLDLTRNREPRFYFYAYHNITHRLWTLGRTEDALERIEEDRRLAREGGGAIDLLKVDWLEGLILMDVGRTDEAEACLFRAMEGLLDHRMATAGIGAGLQLVRLYLRQDRGDQALELIPAMLGRCHDAYEGVLAALLTLQRALREKVATVELVDEIDDFLEEAEVNPSARFEPSTVS